MLAKVTLFCATAALLASANSVFAQTTQAAREAEIRRLVPYSSMLLEDPTITLNDYNRAVRELARRESSTAPRTYTPPSVYVPPAPRSYVAPPPVYTPYSPPDFGSKYDARSGNRYSWYSLGDDTVVRGSNMRTGSTWRTTVKPDGSMRGYDADMNLWKYDAQSGRYTNFGTGVTCVGRGYARTCY